MRFLKFLSVGLVLAGVLSAHALSLKTIEDASIRNDLTELVSYRGQAEQVNDAYVSAFLEYRIGIAANVAQDRKLAKSSLKRAAKILKKKLKVSPDSAAHLALLGNIYGMQIALSPMKGMTLGPKANKLVERAIEIAPSDPNTLLSLGISRYNTPSIFGGNKTEALAALDQAIKAFEVSQDAQWGKAEAHVWRALALDAMERRADAVTALNAALDLEPDFEWARFILSSMEATS